MAVPVENNTVLLSGRISGQLPSSDPAKSCGTPPVALTLERPMLRDANIIVLLGPQLPPMLKPEVLQIRSGAPPAIDTLCNAPSAKNPTQWPSGEKNGCLAPEVPAIAFGSSSLNSRT